MIEGNLASIARKRYGQNFLKDDRYIRQIVQAMPDDSLPIVEIGPGLGDLTKSLLNARKNVTAYEVDERLCAHLKEVFREPLKSGQITIYCQDVMRAWEERHTLLDGKYYLVANLPYYIATAIILRALRDKHCLGSIVMVQKEVAEKFSAKCGDRSFSALSVLSASAGEAKILFEVPPQAFVPSPKVTSAVLSITKRKSLSDSNFEAFLKIAFAQPRKRLAKNLQSRFQKETIESVFEALKLAPSLRPHQVETSVYHRLYTQLKDFMDGKKYTKHTR